MGLVKSKQLAGMALHSDNTKEQGIPIVNIAIFASGAGSNAQKIIQYLTLPPTSLHGEGRTLNSRVALIVCNSPKAGILDTARQENIPTLILDKDKFLHGNGYADELKAAGINFIVLAGFLWKLPVSLIKEYPGHIINIHPALLPQYGGNGMYGRFVHQAVLDNKEKESGITIHYVDELYDHGAIIFQATCPVLENDTADTLAQRVQLLEHAHYPATVESVIGLLAKA